MRRSSPSKVTLPSRDASLRPLPVGETLFGISIPCGYPSLGVKGEENPLGCLEASSLSAMAYAPGGPLGDGEGKVMETPSFKTFSFSLDGPDVRSPPCQTISFDPLFPCMFSPCTPSPFTSRPFPSEFFATSGVGYEEFLRSQEKSKDQKKSHDTGVHDFSLPMHTHTLHALESAHPYGRKKSCGREINPEGAKKIRIVIKKARKKLCFREKNPYQKLFFLDLEKILCLKISRDMATSKRPSWRYRYKILHRMPSVLAALVNFLHPRKNIRPLSFHPIGVGRGISILGTTIPCLLALGLLSGCNSMIKPKKTPLRGKRVLLYQEEEKQREKIPFSKDKILTPAIRVAQWAQPGLNPPHHMGSLALEGEAGWPLVALWKKTVSKAVVLPVAPIATEDRIFIVDHKGFLSAMDWEGKKIWSLQVNYHKDSYGMGGGLATDKERVYVTTPHGWVLALDYCTGKVVWSHALSHPVRNGPCLSHHRLALLTLANQTLLLDTATGKEIWDDQGLKEDTLVLGGSVPAITKDRVVVGTASGEVVALSLTQGDRLWDRPLASINSVEGEGNFRHIHAYPLVVGNHVYATSDSGQMSCFDLYSGDILWSQDGVGGMQTPLVVGETVLTISSTGQCVALDRQSGKEFWAVSLPQNEKWFGPIMAGGLIHVLSEGGNFMALDPLNKGACVFQLALGDSYTTAPLVIKGGLLFLSKNGVLSFYKRQCPAKGTKQP